MTEPEDLAAKRRRRAEQSRRRIRARGQLTHAEREWAKTHPLFRRKAEQ